MSTTRCNKITTCCKVRKYVHNGLPYATVRSRFATSVSQRVSRNVIPQLVYERWLLGRAPSQEPWRDIYRICHEIGEVCAAVAAAARQRLFWLSRVEDHCRLPPFSFGEVFIDSMWVTGVLKEKAISQARVSLSRNCGLKFCNGVYAAAEWIIVKLFQKGNWSANTRRYLPTKV